MAGFEINNYELKKRHLLISGNHLTIKKNQFVYKLQPTDKSNIYNSGKFSFPTLRYKNKIPNTFVATIRHFFAFLKYFHIFVTDLMNNPV